MRERSQAYRDVIALAGALDLMWAANLSVTPEYAALCDTLESRRKELTGAELSDALDDISERRAARRKAGAT